MKHFESFLLEKFNFFLEKYLTYSLLNGNLNSFTVKMVNNVNTIKNMCHKKVRQYLRALQINV
jgi:hypothetical protein